MAKRVYIIHGSGGYPEEHWLPWLKRELERRNFEVHVPQMPQTDYPKIEAWVSCIKKIVGEPDKNIYFVGHSIGCQAILRYLETLDGIIQISGVVFVAPWMALDMKTIEEEGEEVAEIAKPWMETPIDFEKVKSHIKRAVAIFSDNDPYIPLDQKDIFEKKLDAQTVTEHSKGHFTADDGVTELPVVLEELLKMAK